MRIEETAPDPNNAISLDIAVGNRVFVLWDHSAARSQQILEIEEECAKVRKPPRSKRIPPSVTEKSPQMLLSFKRYSMAETRMKQKLGYLDDNVPTETLN